MLHVAQICQLFTELDCLRRQALLVAAHRDGSVAVWDVEKGALVHTIEAHASPISQLVLHDADLITIAEDKCVVPPHAGLSPLSTTLQDGACARHWAGHAAPRVSAAPRRALHGAQAAPPVRRHRRPQHHGRDLRRRFRAHVEQELDLLAAAKVNMHSFEFEDSSAALRAVFVCVRLP